MSALYKLNYIRPSDGLTLDLLSACESVQQMDFWEWKCVLQNGLSIAIVWHLVSSLKFHNDSELFRGIEEEELQPSYHLKRFCQSWTKSMPRGSVAAEVDTETVPSGVLYAPGEGYVRPGMFEELPQNPESRPRRLPTVELPSAHPYWCSIRRYRYPRQYHLRLRIARVEGDLRIELRKQRKEGVREQKKEEERRKRRRKEARKARRQELIRQRKEEVEKRKKFQILKKMIHASCHKELDDLERELKNLDEEGFWASEFGVEVPQHWQKRASVEELLEDYERNKHLYLHHTYVQYYLQYGIDLDELLAKIDPLSKHTMMKEVADLTFLQPVSSMPRALNALIAVDDILSETVESAERLQGVYLSDDKHELPIVIDTGASFSLTPNLEDFISHPTSCKKSLTGLNGSAEVLGTGRVRWKVRDMNGKVKTIETEAYYVPSAGIRLFSPQCYFQANRGGHIVLDKDQIKLTLPDGESMYFPWQRNGNLPFMLTANKDMEAAHIFSDVEASKFKIEKMSVYLNVAHENNMNLTENEKKLLLWHAKTGHANLKWIRELGRWTKKEGHSVPGPLPVKKDQFKKCGDIKCTVCQLAKQHRRSPRTDAASRPDQNSTRARGRPAKEKQLSEDKLKPGDKVSVDQYQSTVLGRRPNTFGSEKSRQKEYIGGTLFVDHATGFVHINHQTTTATRETVKSKHQFERELADQGHTVKTYHADNHPFTSEAFKKDVESHGQSIDYSAVGAHHQNGSAERAIQTITTWARAMLLHQMLHWPDEADTKLWPFAMDHAVYLWNHLPREDTKQAPIELLSGSKLDHHEWFRRLHVWGAPVYVLDPKLQDGKKIPKWDARARRGMYLGFSPSHSSLVSRVLNLQTGYVSPQYHVVIDDLFSTVPNADHGGLFDVRDFDETTWRTLVETGYERHLDDDDLANETANDARRNQLTLANEWLNPREQRVRQSRRAAREARLRLRVAEERRQRKARNQLSVTFSEGDADHSDDHSVQSTASSLHEDHLATTDDDDMSVAEIGPTVDLDSDNDMKPASSPSTRRRTSGRTTARNKRYFNQDFVTLAQTSTKKIKHSALDRQFFAGLKWAESIQAAKSDHFGRLWSQTCEPFYDHDTGLQDDLHPMILVAKANSEDTPTWSDAMNGPLRQGYLDAAQAEIDALHKKDSWDVVDRTPDMHVLPSTWAFRCKRYPDGSVRKLKARFCVRGDRQIQDVDFHETWAPVVNWNTVRLMLILSQVLGLATKQVDYTTAFLHAPIDEEVFVSMPRGFSDEGKVLKLKRCLYGLRQSPRNFFQFLESNLGKIGFSPQREVDPCLFISTNCICLVYVDDTLFFAPEQKYIDEAVAGLRAQNMELEEEDSVAGFLGVHIDRHDDGTLHLTQKGLIKRVIEALGVTTVAPTPAHTDPLAIDAEGDPPDGLYNYASVVGMLLYLSGHSRPDICMAVSQVARFIHGNRRSHEVAIERIGRYLLGTQDKGLILSPTKTFDIECYVDSDFAGLWNVEDHRSPESVRSRAGYTICICGCPIMWKSQLMRPIAASTMEAEYNALALSMRDVLPLQELFKTIGSAVGISPEITTTFKTIVHEDNQGAQKLACMEPGHHTPRSKSFWTRAHWFRQHLKPNRTTVAYINTTLQKADILTKGLSKEKFLRCRRLLCGW